jgi:hypothetical protein
MAAGISPNHRLQVGQSYRRTPDGSVSTCVQQEGVTWRCGCSQGREDGEGGGGLSASDRPILCIDGERACRHQSGIASTSQIIDS